MLKNYFSLVKFSHTIFALPFALWGFFLAVKHGGYQFDYAIFIAVLLCMLFARNSAMGFNRLIDREIDKKNSRTANREIPAGKIKTKHALAFVIINSLLFITVCYFINSLVFFLSPVALFVVLGYSYTKRFTAFCHLILGLGLSLAPIGAFLAVSGQFEFLPVIYSLAVLFWVSGFDIIYALQDIKFDSSQNLHSIPVALGIKKSIFVSRLLHFGSAFFIFIGGLPKLGNFNFIYWIGVFVFVSLLIYQHNVVKHNNLARINMAFFTLNGIAGLLFAGFAISSLYFF